MSSLSSPLPALRRGPPSAVADDPELLALPAPPKQERALSIGVLAVTMLAAAALGLTLLGEARYALGPSGPLDVGELARLEPTPAHANRYVHATGLLGATGAIRYERAAEGDSFRLSPVAGNPRLWVEIRVPEGFEGPRFVPPTEFAGRLVPLGRAGLRHARVPELVREATRAEIPEGAWLLVDGTSPRSCRWAVGMAALFGLFAAWNGFALLRVLRRVRDAAEGLGGEAA